MGSSQSSSEQTLTHASVTVYSTRHCPYCQRARALLARKNVTFTEIDVGNDAALWDVMQERSGRDTVPQIFIGETHVGGYDDMAALERLAQLDSLLYPHKQ